MSAPGMSGHVARLETAGLIERTRAADRRRIGLTLTPDGVQILASVRKRANRLARRASGRPDRRASARRSTPRSRTRATARGACTVTLLQLASATEPSPPSDTTATTASSSRASSRRSAGTWMQNIALAWVVLQLAPHSRGLAVGVLILCRFGPFTLFGLDRRSGHRPVRQPPDGDRDSVGADDLLGGARRRSHCSGTSSRGRSTRSRRWRAPPSSSTRRRARTSRSRWSAATSFRTRSRSTRASSTSRASSGRPSRAS